MPRRSMLTAADRENLLALPESDDELIRHYTFSETDRSLIRLRRGDANRLGFAVQLCLLRYPGHALAADGDVPEGFCRKLDDLDKNILKRYSTYPAKA